MGEINWFGKLPTQTRAEIIQERSQIPEEDRAEMLNYGEAYFDGNVPWGYQGYQYDGRFEGVVQRMIEHYGLTTKSRILEVGCAKAYILYEFYKKGFRNLQGMDISDYAIANVPEELKGQCHVGSAHDLSRYEDDSFDLIISKDVLHNLPPELADEAIREMARVGTGNGVVQLGAYENENQKKCLEAWIITIKTVRSSAEWRRAFAQNGYQGDYYFLCHDYEIQESEEGEQPLQASS